MKTLKLYFLFFKTKFLPPLTLAIFVLIKYQLMLLALIAMIVTTLLVYFYDRFIEDRKREKLHFYYNLGITELKLYAFIFFINLFIITITNICMRWII